MFGFGSDALDVDVDADALSDGSSAVAASFSTLDASGTHKPESTQRFRWYFASSSGILAMVSWSNAMSRLSKQFWSD